MARKSIAEPRDAFESLRTAQEAARRYEARCRNGTKIRKINKPGRLKYELLVKLSCPRSLRDPRG